MDIYVLNDQFTEIMLIDQYISFIWVDRYDFYGDFELCLPLNIDIFLVIKDALSKDKDYYVEIDLSDRTMIIEDISIDDDIEDGPRMTITGRSSESILDRRIVWFQTNLDGNIDSVIQRLFNENIINPTDANRRISNISYISSNDSRITDILIEAQFTGDNLLDAICALAVNGPVGLKSVRNGSNFVFSLYYGEDRSYDQNDNSYVVFSPNFDNILSSNFYLSKASFKNVALVAGEGEGTDRKTLSVGSDSGQSRRELYIDARDISSKTDDGSMSISDYNAKLKNRGEESLNDYKYIDAFEGEADYSRNFKYGEDYRIGDIVQFEDILGNTGKARIVETVISQDESGFKMYPTFEMIEGE